MSMTHLFFITLTISAIFSDESPCRKLYFFGNNIQNKALLSPIIIVGQREMKIPIGNDEYKAAIDIKKIIKGSANVSQTNRLIAGQFSSKNDSDTFCNFNSYDEELIYFLRVLSSQNSEYSVIFNSEIANYENLEVINKAICNNCAGIPRLWIKDQSLSENSMYLDCITESKPPSMIKWTDSNGQNLEVMKLRNGARLNIKSGQNIIKGLYVCVGTNVLGESTTSIIIKAKITSLTEVTRCSMNDKVLCNNHGKCYKDQIDGGNMFCRCDPGFLGAQCTDDQNKLSDSYLIRASNIDETYCNDKGEGYKNAITNEQYCICIEGFYGQRCSDNILQNVNYKGTMMRSNNAEAIIRYHTEIKRLMNEASSKVSITYIIIGAIIVLAGCIIIIAVIIITWKCFNKRSSKHIKKVNGDDKKSIGTNNTMNNLSLKSNTKCEDSHFILPVKTEMIEIPKSPKPPIQNNNHQDIYDYREYFGEGIYEGINMPSIKGFKN